ncbi:MAG: hypothetical protein HQ559_08755, partial [Lentisphaerae bacterium]|nr:hypothetical protein [Lentisphaerota bacterium]
MRNTHNLVRASLCAVLFSFILAAGTAMGGDVVSTQTGDWDAGATWGGTAPTAGDDVFVASGHTVTIYGAGTTNINSLSVSGTLEHAANASTEANKVNLDIANDCTVATGGAIDVSYKGYAQAQGPGANTGERGGAGHGGEGGFGWNANTTRSDTYGSVTNPVRCGSGARYQIGGGVVILTVGGALTNNGTITANGEGEATTELTGGGSGGSVNITAGTIAGVGIISADGGEGETGNAGGGGGGGRVAIRLTQGGATFGSFTVANISAIGGDSGSASNGDPSSGGTVYLETQAQGSGGGTVTINHFEASLARTHVPAEIDGVLDELDGAMVILTNWGRAASTTNAGIGDLLI